jgi:hypothetical protein
MKFVAIFFVTVAVVSCTYSQRVNTFDDVKLCEKLGVYTLKSHEEGIFITQKAISARPIDKKWCSTIAEEKIVSFMPDYKLELCQNLAKYHYHGVYDKYKFTLDTIKDMHFADEECIAMSEFYFIRLARQREKFDALKEALNHASEASRGTRSNPIHVIVN